MSRPYRPINAFIYSYIYYYYYYYLFIHLCRPTFRLTLDLVRYLLT